MERVLLPFGVNGRELVYGEAVDIKGYYARGPLKAPTAWGDVDRFPAYMEGDLLLAAILRLFLVTATYLLPIAFVEAALGAILKSLVYFSITF